MLRRSLWSALLLFNRRESSLYNMAAGRGYKLRIVQPRIFPRDVLFGIDQGIRNRLQTQFGWYGVGHCLAGSENCFSPSEGSENCFSPSEGLAGHAGEGLLSH